MTRSKLSFYPIMISLLMFVFPVISIIIEWKTKGTPMDMLLIGKWFIFWGLGIRLFSAGIRQISNPAFTAKQIFRISSDDSIPLVKEIGFGNIAMGLLSILSVFMEQWRDPAAIVGGVYIGLAGIMHLNKKPDSTNEMIALVSDLFIFIVALIYLAVSLNR